MKRTLWFIFFLLNSLFYLYADSENDSLLKVLDKVISERLIYTQKKEATIKVFAIFTDYVLAALPVYQGQMDALVGLSLPLLHQQNFILLLGGEIVVVADAALLPADGIGNALHHDLTDEGLPAAGLGRIDHI